MDGPVTSATPKGRVDLVRSASDNSGITRHLPGLSSTSLSVTPDFCPKPAGAPAKRGHAGSNVPPEKTITREECFMLSRLFAPKVTVSAHCDLPCGVYDPAQARIEAESVKAIQEKMAGNDDPHFQARATVIKEQRAELAKHHVSVLWSDYFKPPHFEKYQERSEERRV